MKILLAVLQEVLADDLADKRRKKHNEEVMKRVQKEKDSSNPKKKSNEKAEIEKQERLQDAADSFLYWLSWVIVHNNWIDDIDENGVKRGRTLRYGTDENEDKGTIKVLDKTSGESTEVILKEFKPKFENYNDLEFEGTATVKIGNVTTRIPFNYTWGSEEEEFKGTKTPPQIKDILKSIFEE